MRSSIPLVLMVWKWSFYTCDETWNQEDEISLFDTGVLGEQKNNEDYKLSDLLDEKNTK
jgi:hypothetical protein